MATQPSTLSAWYRGQLVYLNVPPNSLVFDGQNFVRPSDVQQVALVTTVPVGPVTVPGPWPETNTLQQAALSWLNTWICKVADRGSQTTGVSDVVSVSDPNNGQCVCGVTCEGTDLQYVQVLVDTSPDL